MGRRKVDTKIFCLIKHCILSNQRSFFFVFGEKSRNQVVVLNHILLRVRNEFKKPKPTVLWCFKDSKFNFASQKAQRCLKKKYSRNYSIQEEDIYDHFLVSTSIKFCHYSDTTSVLGQTFNALIIQDFEAITPNILARVIECVEGGGIIIMIIPSVKTFQEIATLKMDAHSKYVTSANSSIDPVFNLRFMLSLAECENCIVLDDNLKVLLCPANLDSVGNSLTLAKRKIDCTIQNNSLEVLDRISSLCCTTDQSNALQVFIRTLKEKCTRSVVSITSARGRGKSATLGLAVSCALYLKYSCIYVTSPQVENLQTLFKFILNGIKAIDYKEGKDYSEMFNVIENKKLISGINIFHDQRQTVKYLLPTEFFQVGNFDLVIIDEAAAIPLPVVKTWLKADLVFMASTINGYEGTGRSLSLKLLNQLREQSQLQSCKENFSSEKKFTFREIILNEAIRYVDGDGVEVWLNKLFCLDTEITHLNGVAPNPEECQLYYVNKNILFSYQKIAEKFLQQLVALFVSSHYKNSPNDLLMMADAPSHHLFCLLPPVDKKAQFLPNALCVIQVALEGKISEQCVSQDLSHGKRASGDLVPWIISQQFQDNSFPLLSGARVVRIATHPSVQRMGYGQRALNLLFSYYGKKSETDISSKDIKKQKTALLLSLNELEANKLDYIGVSYGLTLELLKFWKKLEFVPLYLRQTSSETTGEHSCVMVKNLNAEKSTYLSEYLYDFLQRFSTLLSSSFKNLPAVLALEILHYRRNIKAKDSFVDLNIHSILTACSIKRLEAYCNHLVDYHLIMDLIPLLARCYFINFFEGYFLSSVQEVVLLSMGLQYKPVEEISAEIKMETSQVMGLFMKVVKKILQCIVNLKKNSQMMNHHYEKNSYFCEEIGSKRKNEWHGKDKKKKHKTSS